MKTSYVNDPCDVSPGAFDLSTHLGVSKKDPLGPVPANPPGISWQVVSGSLSSPLGAIVGNSIAKIGLHYDINRDWTSVVKISLKLRDNR